MSTPHATFRFKVGATVKITGTVNDASGNPLDINGATFEWKLTDEFGIVTIFTKTLGDGIVVVDIPTASILVTLTPVETATLKPGMYRDQLKVTLATGIVDDQWEGLILFERQLS